MAFNSHAQVQLPTLGDRISGFISLQDEYELGRNFLRSVRRSAPTISDPLLNEYVVNITHKLASNSELRDHRLAFVLIDSTVLNAFAAPGGIIGVNAGLFISAETEGEFASVLAHELAHVSQRHFARSVEEQQRTRIPQLASLLASVVIMATSGVEHGQAAIMATQGYGVEGKLRFSRSNEAEADRLGIKTLYDSGFDPNDMSNLFERLMAIGRYGRKPPEFLLTHPLTENRVSDTRARARLYPPREHRESLEYGLMRSRILAHYETDKSAMISKFKQQLEESETDIQRDINQYGLAMAYQEDRQFQLARNALAPLLAKDPNRISYVSSLAEIMTEGDEPLLALAFLKKHLGINPDNHPLTMAYADALSGAREYSEAVKVLENHAVIRPEDHALWSIIAETQGRAGNISKVHQARAEYLILQGDYLRAREQISFALKLETENGPRSIQVTKLKQKMRDIEALQRAVRA